MKFEAYGNRVIVRRVEAEKSALILPDSASGVEFTEDGETYLMVGVPEVLAIRRKAE